VIIFFLLLLAIALAYLDAKELKDPEKKIRNKAIVKICIITIAALLQAFNEHIKEQASQDDKLANKKTLAFRDSIYVVKITKAQKSYEDSLRKYSKDNSEQIQSTAYNMTRIFGEGVKKGEVNTKNILTNTDENSKKLAVKLDSNKLKSANIELLREPHKAFKTRVDGNNIIGECWIENSGDETAYSLSFNVYIVFKTSLGFFKTHVAGIENITQNLSGGTARIVNINIAEGLGIYNDSDRIYCLVIGNYYNEETKNSKKEFRIGVYKNKATGENLHYQEPISIEEFLKSATLLN